MTPINPKVRLSDYLPHQQKFLQCQKPNKALVAGFGSGKTYVFLKQTLLNHLTMLRANRKSNGWVVYPTLDLADELFVEPFQELLTTKQISYKYNASKMHFKTTYGDIRIFSLQRPHRMVGSELTFAGFDEFDVESIKNCQLAYNKVTARLRGSAKTSLYIVTTPEGFKTTYEIFVEKADDTKELIHARTMDNPHLPDGYIDRLKSQYDAKLLEQYLLGRFVNLNGVAAYYAFKRDKHVVPDELVDNREILIGMDFNVNPMTAVCAAKVAGRLVIFDEIYMRNSNTPRMCEVIKQKFPGREIVVYPDMTGIKRITSAHIGVTDISILQRAGFRINGVNNLLVRDRLANVNNAVEKRQVIVQAKCKHLIRDFEQVVRDKHGEIDKENPDLTHISDAAGYLISREFPMIKRGAVQL